MIDTHVYFWRLARGDYGWLTADRAEIYRDSLPEDLAPVIDPTPVTGVIAVQAAPSEAETQWLHEQARRYDWIVGVTEWIDLIGPDPVAALRRVGGDGKLVGIRSMEGIGRGPDWLNAPAFARGIDAIAASGLVFEVLLLPHHLPGLQAIARRHSAMPIIINHAAKPTPETFEAWVADLGQVAELDNVWCKLSGADSAKHGCVLPRSRV